MDLGEPQERAASSAGLGLSFLNERAGVCLGLPNCAYPSGGDWEVLALELLAAGEPLEEKRGMIEEDGVEEVESDGGTDDDDEEPPRSLRTPFMAMSSEQRGCGWW